MTTQQMFDKLFAEAMKKFNNYGYGRFMAAAYGLLSAHGDKDDFLEMAEQFNKLEEKKECLKNGGADTSQVPS